MNSEATIKIGNNEYTPLEATRYGLAILSVLVGFIAMAGDDMNILWGAIGLWGGLLLWQPLHGILIFYSIISIYPVLRVISVSLRPTSGLLSRSLALIPPGATLRSFTDLFEEEDFLLWVWNSFSITVTVAIIGVMVSATGAYAFSRWRFPGRRPALIFLLTTQMIPAGMLIIPIFVIVSRLQLTNNIVGLMLAYISTAVPFSIWILKGYFDTIPPELEEAARVDGCTHLEAFWRIILPLSTPALSIVFLFNFLGSWSEFIVADVILKTAAVQTWPLGLNELIGTFNTDWAKYAAGSVLVTVPVLILFTWQSRYLISGLTLGSVKG